MEVYEIGFHIVPFVGDEGVAHEVSKVKDALDKVGASVISEDFPRFRVLAYPIAKAIKGEKKNCKEAYFGWVKFELATDALEAFKKDIEKIENLLRYLIVKTVKENTLYSAKFAREMKEGKKERKEDGTPEAPKEAINVVELDKSIDNLVV